MREDERSPCPINLSLEVFGDRWSLLIVRDMMFAGKRHFREFLQSEEGISSNILAQRLAQLVAHGIVTKADDPNHQLKAIYSLTEKGIALLPILAEIGAWGARFRPVTQESAATAKQLEKGGPALRRKLSAELRRAHVKAA